MNTKMKKISKIISGIVAGLTFMLMFTVNINADYKSLENQEITIQSLQKVNADGEGAGNFDDPDELPCCECGAYSSWNYCLDCDC